LFLANALWLPKFPTRKKKTRWRRRNSLSKRKNILIFRTNWSGETASSRKSFEAEISSVDSTISLPNRIGDCPTSTGWLKAVKV